MSPPPKKTLFVFDQIRTRSHLLFRYFSTSPQLDAIPHPFLEAASAGPDRWFYDPNIAENGKDVLQNYLPIMSAKTHTPSAEEFADKVAAAHEKGLVPFANEHVHYVLKPEVALPLYNKQLGSDNLPHNPTYIPDHVWETMQPIILIRHPVLQVDSGFRAIYEAFKTKDVSDDFAASTSCRMAKVLYEHLRRQGKEPLVIDGEDLLWRTQEMTENFCSRTGIDASNIKDTWTLWPAEQRQENPFLLRFMSTIYESTGIERPEGRSTEPDAQAIYSQWLSKYGDKTAKQLRYYVEVSMPHYEWLKARKI